MPVLSNVDPSRVVFRSHQIAGGAPTRKAVTSQPKPLIGPNYGVDRDVYAMQEASKITQDRAKVDRDAAIKALDLGKSEAMGFYNSVGDEMISKGTQDQIYAEGREIAEAERQSMLKNIQSSYYSGSMPSGASIEASLGVDQAKMGTLAQLKRKIGIESAEKNWTSRFQKAEGMSGVTMDTATSKADVLGNTIAETPDYSSAYKSINEAQTNQWNKQQAEAKKAAGAADFGRKPGEMNVDFKNRDPKGFEQWRKAGMPNYQKPQVWSNVRRV